MNNPQKINAVSVSQSSEFIELLQTLSAVYLTSVERLAALNLNRAREAIEECAAAARTPVQANGTYNLQGALSGIAEPMWQKTLAYSRSASEIVAETHEEMTKAMTGQFSSQNLASFWTNRSSTMSDVFMKGVQQMATTASANMAAVDAARVKAGSAILAETKKAA